jgi:hypothetical protein
MAAPTNAANVKRVLANSEPMVWTTPCLRGEIANVNYIEGGLVMQIVRIGLDLAKYVFEVHGVDAHGKIIVRKTLRRDAVSIFFANIPPCLLALQISLFR